MFSRLFYLTLGFAVGYFISSLQQDRNADEVQLISSMSDDLASEPVIADPVPILLLDKESPDFLQQINGIGPIYAKRLFDGGIRSFAALAEATAEELVRLTKARNQSQVEDWIEQAYKKLH